MDSSSVPTQEKAFDFAAHTRQAVEGYQRVRSRYEDLATVVREVVRQCLEAAAIRVHSIEARAKGVDSFSRKAGTPLESDPAKPKYRDPLVEITDLAGIRVITFFPPSVSETDAVIAAEFEVLEKSDKAAALVQEERFGYQSIHYQAKLSGTRCALPEYARFADAVFEIQVRTILQHAWAEIEHDIQYKSVETIPRSIRRRFMSLAGMLEIADREFQAVQDEDEMLRQAARASVLAGRLQDVEITPDALKAFLDTRLGPDGRMSDFSYQFTAEVLRQIGFGNLHQVDEGITGYNDDIVSRTIWNSRRGQISRFEDCLLAGMGEEYILRHRWAVEPWFIKLCLESLSKLEAARIPLRSYRPTPNVANGKRLVVQAAVDRIRGRNGDNRPLDQVLSMLAAPEAKVLRLLYGFDGDRHYSLEEVASMLGLPVWQVSQVRDQALSTLEEVVAPTA